ncbi:hypothetical protein G5B30_16590 [Sphingobacterium sp. SGG-5]|nr:hypothetical protein [Sphingobacterium sp. SGG-5]
MKLPPKNRQVAVYDKKHKTWRVDMVVDSCGGGWSWMYTNKFDVERWVMLPKMD